MKYRISYDNDMYITKIDKSQNGRTCPIFDEERAASPLIFDLKSARCNFKLILKNNYLYNNKRFIKIIPI